VLNARDISEIERAHSDGLSSQQILELCEKHGHPLSEATLRKYVQLGLLPRSRRVGQKGKHRGSRGIYPVEVIRRIDEIRRAMTAGDTLETLAGHAQGVRARLASARVALEEALEAAEADLKERDERAQRAELQALKKDAKAWLQRLERLADKTEAQDEKARRERAKKLER
jgi:DNA-binding transcriptional MerR regulator